MAINIGNEAVKAISELRGNPDFARMLDALDITVRDLIYASIRTPVEQRVHQTSMFFGMQELIDGMSMAYQDKKSGQLDKTPPPASPRFRRNEHATETSMSNNV